MSYLGNAPARSFISFERQVFTIVNSQTAYALSHSVTNENDIRLVVNNVVQEPGSGKAYTATGTALTLSAALTNGTDEMYCVFLGRATATSAPGAGSIGTAQLAADAVTNAKIADDAISDEQLDPTVITGQTAEATVADDDTVLIHDASATALRKMTVANLTANAGTAGISSSADATAMTITSAEKIGIGETTPLTLVHIKQADSGQGTVNADTSQLVIEDNSTAGITLLGGTGGTGAIFFGDSGDNDIGLIEYDHGANSMAFKTNATEQMRLTDNGSMLLGGTATQASTPNIYIHAAGAMIFLRRKTSNGNVAEFINTSNEVKGSITVSSTNTSYNTSSDYRLKENVATMEDATTRLKQLQPKRFNYISDESNTVVDGFLAHEVSSIVPEAITGEKDAIKVWQEGEKLPEGVSVGDNKLDENGNTIPDFQSIDQSKLVPLLVKTIQELEARITELENE